MSYRTVKRVLGETSLERKCRFLFGAALLVLILGSFLWYGAANERLVNQSTRSICHLLVEPVLFKLHVIAFSTDKSIASNVEEGKLIKQVGEDLRDLEYDAEFLSLEPVKQSALDTEPRENPRRAKQATAEWEVEILEELRDSYQGRLAELSARETAGGRSVATDENDVPENEDNYATFETVKPVYKDGISADHKEYFYYQPVNWKESCVACHLLIYGITPDAKRPMSAQADRLPFQAVKISYPYEETARTINRNRAAFWTMAIITVFLSMVALYIVVRYVIVKPLQHLQEVSEQVEQGNYEARAEIETNDEFEELAHAYNRMLRHMVDAQDKMREANVQLDAKVDQLAQANMQLFETNRVKSEFLANVSHELRTPLNSIIGFSDVLQNLESLQDKERRYASNIGRSGRVLLDMINDILDLAKLESGKTQLYFSEFLIEKLVRTQCDVIRPMAEDKNIDVSIECPPDLPDMFQDQGKVHQILTNLLSNAIKFTPEGGRVKVVVATDGQSDKDPPERLLLTVEDTGVGIADEDRDVIFEKFRQATATRGSDNLTREFSGTGLGLSIVRELSKLMQGEVSFVSELGKGSAFTVRLPWVLAQSANVQPVGAVGSGSNGSTDSAPDTRPQPTQPTSAAIAPSHQDNG